MSASTPETLPAGYRGLAPFLRQSIAGIDLRAACQTLLQEAAAHPDDAPRWLTLATAMLAMENRDMGLALQAQALAMQRVYHLAASEAPACLRVLLLMVPGDLSANTPLECLFEYGDVELIQYYLGPDELFAAAVPPHDIVLVAVSEADAHRETLAALVTALADWPVPVINRPHCLPATGRVAASDLLQGVPGLAMPLTWRCPFAALYALAQGASAGLADVHGAAVAAQFPFIVRPVGSHGGHGLARIETRAELAGYLAQSDAEAFFVSPFIDYRGADGQFRKYRIALIDGQAFACHMAISTHWMIHYVNAGMYEDAAKRAEEAQFMAGFAQFAARHRVALHAIAARSGLDYVCVDCAQTPQGELLVFEIDHAMIVHAMDSETLFPHKQKHIGYLRAAFRQMLLQRCGKAASDPAVG